MGWNSSVGGMRCCEGGRRWSKRKKKFFHRSTSIVHIFLLILYFLTFFWTAYRVWFHCESAFLFLFLSHRVILVCHVWFHRQNGLYDGRTLLENTFLVGPVMRFPLLSSVPCHFITKLITMHGECPKCQFSNCQGTNTTWEKEMWLCQESPLFVLPFKTCTRQGNIHIKGMFLKN